MADDLTATTERVDGIPVLLSQAKKMGIPDLLAEYQDKLAGLSAGNPKRTTSRPTAEALLTAFKGIDLSVVTIGDQLRRHVMPLSALRKKIRSLPDFPTEIYRQLAGEFPGPAGQMIKP